MREVKVNSKWRHFKGSEVTVVALAKDSEDLKELVVYTHNGETWVRPKDEFLSEVDHKKYPYVKQKYRFEELGGGIR